jgi:conjugal transfer pilin signal peptidase TrbI
MMNGHPPASSTAAPVRHFPAIAALSPQAFLRRFLLRRFDRAVFRERLIRHFRRWTLAYLLAALAAAWFDANFTVGLNVTESLPDRFFLIHRGEQPGRGDYVAFRWPGGGPYPAGVTFIKQIAGLSGDVVTQVDRDYFVNGQPMGHAKPLNRQGLTLEPGPTGTLPDAAYYVRAQHPDSLDSRYGLTGWVSQAQIIGRAHALF